MSFTQAISMFDINTTDILHEVIMSNVQNISSSKKGKGCKKEIEMSQIIGDFLNDLLEGMRERLDKKLEEVALEEENIGIQKATAAMCEAGVEDGKIIDLLQKYWNLRPSEAKDFLSRERHD